MSSGIAFTTSLSTRDVALAFHPELVLSLGDVTHRFQIGRHRRRHEAMTASPAAALSRRTLTVPFPRQVAEMKIQPSLERVNGNELPDFEIEATSSSSETRLFCFFSPDKTTVASPPRAISETNIDDSNAVIRVTRMVSRLSF